MSARLRFAMNTQHHSLLRRSWIAAMVIGFILSASIAGTSRLGPEVATLSKRFMRLNEYIFNGTESVTALAVQKSDGNVSSVS